MKQPLRLILMFFLVFVFLFSCTNNVGDKPKVSAANVSAVEIESETSPVSSNQLDDQDEIAQHRQNAITRAVAEVSPAVVGINVTQIREYIARSPLAGDPFFRQFFPDYRYQEMVQDLGSGFLISSDGYIITNHHVVENAREILVTLPGGKEYQAKTVGEDFVSDIALLKIDGSDLPFIKFGDSDKVIIGEWAIALGNPFGLFDVNSKPIVTVGVISATDQDFGRQSNDRVYEDMIQTDAAINGGNSGGPLVNSHGEVIGINTWIISGSDTKSANIGLGFAIPINRVKRIIDELKSSGGVDRSFWTGIHYDQLTRHIARFLGVDPRNGVIVSDIDKGSPADRAGLRVGDVIIEINNKPIHGFRDVQSIIDDLDLKPGDVLDLKVIRKRHQISVKVSLEKHPRAS